ncbi:uncharacterized protein L3040_000930 [Drepanopeziza brunnea f. sp. 'multigermtubi']|uniref:Lipolytic enzyme n=1 Tax=Marssonina brunnea f. sp. multigermtubi (strain MB_m1) TaxID=1072389 RepID=K1Y6J7_MARBU|nr:lipolytic enzyme [Drepanopeziza brunnea f. sp. 'multigermtubi' MB_m1]EKD20824.1 lipolytic enzyme [Drepanopeziza brunnea f. sp. 'multigermtubi' MB_m1]KAJ5054664.1 hypothetical protein L3040_000930 [Drepanopeziza brunnea f. sp. 'multigermtubi']
MYFLQSLKPGAILLLQFAFWTTPSVAFPAPSRNITYSNFTLADQDVPLRILPLGNSITFGYLSTDGNGYRNELLTKLTSNGTEAQYLGSVRAGNMTDNYNEGHPGATIDQIANFSRASLPMRPNLILLMAGTNDMVQNLSIGAPERLASLVDMCIAACPDAVILLAQLTPSATTDVESRIETFNPEVVALANSRASNGAKIAAIDMPAYVSVDDLKDGLHPNDYGYSKMAEAWYGGIQDAVDNGWLTTPAANTVVGVMRNITTPVVLSSDSSRGRPTFVILHSLVWLAVAALLL